MPLSSKILQTRIPRVPLHFSSRSISPPRLVYPRAAAAAAELFLRETQSSVGRISAARAFPHSLYSPVCKRQHARATRCPGQRITRKKVRRKVRGMEEQEQERERKGVVPRRRSWVYNSRANRPKCPDPSAARTNRLYCARAIVGLLLLLAVAGLHRHTASDGLTLLAESLLKIYIAATFFFRSLPSPFRQSVRFRNIMRRRAVLFGWYTDWLLGLTQFYY